MVMNGFDEWHKGRCSPEMFMMGHHKLVNISVGFFYVWDFFLPILL